MPGAGGATGCPSVLMRASSSLMRSSAIAFFSSAAIDTPSESMLDVEIASLESSQVTRGPLPRGCLDAIDGSADVARELTHDVVRAVVGDRRRRSGRIGPEAGAWDAQERHPAPPVR